jgi:hypothetical protein
MSTDELLLQLRGIAPPGEPGWWPLAPGWWILTGAGLVAMLALLLFARRQYNSRNFKLANRELQGISDHYKHNQDNQNLILNLSRWLRQVSLMAFPERKIAGITGLAWLEFLDEEMGKSEFRQGPGQIFGTAVYSRQLDFDDDTILALCELWMVSIKPQLVSNGRGQKC